MSRWATRLLLALLLCANGCDSNTATAPTNTGGSPGSSADTVSGRAASGSSRDQEALPEASFDIVVGTGRNTYMPLSDGDTLYLELGHQGLQHALVSVRALDLAQDRYVVDFKLIRDDGVTISEPARVRLPFKEMADGSGAELLGYTLVVADPALGVGHDGVLRVTVEGPEGGIAVDERNVSVEWAPSDWDPDA